MARAAAPLGSPTSHGANSPRRKRSAHKADQIAPRIEKVATTEPVDGLWIDGQNRIYLSSLQDNAVKVLAEGRITTLVQDSRLRWPDTFAQGAMRGNG